MLTVRCVTLIAPSHLYSTSSKHSHLHKSNCWSLEIAKSFLRFANFIHPRGLVKMSATWLALETCSTLTSLESTFSHTKWCWISMCLVWTWNTRLFPSLIEDWLSQNSLKLLPLVNPIGLNNLFIYKHSFVPSWSPCIYLLWTWEFCAHC